MAFAFLPRMSLPMTASLVRFASSRPSISRPAFVAAAALVTAAALAGCSAPGEITTNDHHEQASAENVKTVALALTPSDPVSKAVDESCTTASLKELSKQLVDEIQCLRPGTLTNIENTSGLALGDAVFPYLQTPAAQALVQAQKARGVKMSINSALRTLPAQYLLYRWYQTGRCGIGLAAKPGNSNHESAIAVDIEDNAAWRTAMQNANFRWLGSSDPVHFDFVGTGAVEIRGLSVLAFQRLWNRNHPEDLIDEDGDYGAQTEARLAKAPVGGFAKGVDCTGAADAGVADAGPLPEEVPQVPDAEEPATQTDPPLVEEDNPESGCTVRPGSGSHGSRAPFADARLACALSAVAALVLARRRRGGRRVGARTSAPTLR